MTRRKNANRDYWPANEECDRTTRTSHRKWVTAGRRNEVSQKALKKRIALSYALTSIHLCGSPNSYAEIIGLISITVSGYRRFPALDRDMAATSWHRETASRSLIRTRLLIGWLRRLCDTTSPFHHFWWGGENVIFKLAMPKKKMKIISKEKWSGMSEACETKCKIILGGSQSERPYK